MESKTCGIARIGRVYSEHGDEIVAMRKVNFQPAVLIVVVAGFFWSTDASAACTGSSPNWNSSPDRSSVAACVSSARTGDTINVSAGSASWSSNINITDKAISVVGAGAGVTVIGTKAFTLTNSASRISGFTFNLAAGSGYFLIEGSVGFRIDHNIITLPQADTAVLAYGLNGKPVEGLIDNNNITYGRVVYYGDNNSPGTAGSNRWAEPLDIGTSKALYVEDNTIRWLDGSSSGYLNHMDGNYGCRYVARFNTIIGGRFEAHALQGNNERACRLWEIYNNTMTNPANPGYRPFLIRGGTGMIFHNTTDGRNLNERLFIDNPRTHQDDVIAQTSIIGACNGSSWADGNQSGGEGYPCRDQIGRSTDASQWNYSNPAPSQAFYAAYLWRNTNPAGEIPVTLNCVGSATQCTRQATKHIVINRDYYTYSASFNGTSGVGEGPLASRPTTCTPGVGYWATDQGEWNSKNSGRDGQLYKCTAANTWSVHYVPYSYPHPLQNGTWSTSPAPPSNVRIIR